MAPSDSGSKLFCFKLTHLYTNTVGDSTTEAKRRPRTWRSTRTRAVSVRAHVYCIPVFKAALLTEACISSFDFSYDTATHSWDARVLQELPCVPIPRAYMSILIPGFNPWQNCNCAVYFQLYWGFGKCNGLLNHVWWRARNMICGLNALQDTSQGWVQLTVLNKMQVWMCLFDHGCDWWLAPPACCVIDRHTHTVSYTYTHTHTHTRTHSHTYTHTYIYRYMYRQPWNFCDIYLIYTCTYICIRVDDVRTQPNLKVALMSPSE